MSKQQNKEQQSNQANNDSVQQEQQKINQQYEHYESGNFNESDYLDDNSPQLEQQRNQKAMVYAVMFLALVVLVVIILSWLGKKDKKEITEPTNTEVLQTKIDNKNFGVAQRDSDTPIFDLPTEPNATLQIQTQVNSNNDLLSSAENLATKVKFKPQVFKTGGSAVITTNKPKQIDDSNKSKTWTDINKEIKDEQEFEDGIYMAKAASKNKFNPSLLLEKGTYIGCSLNTRIVSMISGQVVCTINEDIYSSNSVTLLIEKGSKIYGNFKSGTMNDGVNRIFVAWNEIRTPYGINIPVSSGASDELGGSGIKGYIDHQWFIRFGASVLLSIIDDSLNYIANGKRDSSYDYTEGSREATQQMAHTALEEFIKIKPVLYRNQGDIVGVLVNRDIDFSKVYKLKIGHKE